MMKILEQLKTLEKDHPTHRVFNHCMVVRLSLEGYTQREIAKIVAAIRPLSIRSQTFFVSRA